MKNRIIQLSMLLASLCSLVSCNHSDDDIQDSSEKIVKATFKQVELDWQTNTFKHGEYVIEIPEKWKMGFLGQRDKFKEYDPHDIEFYYTLVEKKTYGGNVFYETFFSELKKVDPKEKEKIFEITTAGLDIDSKLLVKDELANDYYFKYDTNTDFYNYCYFKIAKNDVNQLKNGYFNQINVKLKYYYHVDEALSFVTTTSDGLNYIGKYSDVSISHNPDNLN